MNYRQARWILPNENGLFPDSGKLSLTSTTMAVNDKDDNPVLLFESDWAIQWALDRNNGLRLASIHGT